MSEPIVPEEDDEDDEEVPPPKVLPLQRVGFDLLAAIEKYDREYHLRKFLGEEA